MKLGVKDRLKNLLRPLRDVVWVARGFLYDWARFARFGGWRVRLADPNERSYRATKLYHKLEKSLSIRNRTAGSGWKAAVALARLLKASPPSDRMTTQERSAHAALVAFLVAEEGTPNVDDARLFVASVVNNSPEVLNSPAGAASMHATDLLQGRLPNPEQFFCSRVSVRDFAPICVADEDVKRAIALAQRSPSVCNRQAWHVYHLRERAVIDCALSFQNGNRGFGQDVKCLLVVCTDLRAFDEPGERFQHWIDGGMFSMALVLGFHSLGLATCCLNWSQTPAADKALRSALRIADSHTVVMMIAVGYSREQIQRCVSARRDLAEIYTELSQSN